MAVRVASQACTQPQGAAITGLKAVHSLQLTCAFSKRLWASRRPAVACLDQAWPISACMGQNELTESQAQHVLRSLPNCRLPCLRGINPWQGVVAP